MSAGSWALYFALVLGATVLVLWLYLRLEPPGRGRPLLAALRVAAFALVLLLIFDPPLPGAERPAAARRPVVLLDASASMALPERAGAAATRWQAALEEVRERGGNPILFGDVARPAAADSLPPEPPGDARSRLLPALQAAAEAGASRVTVITDAALEDAAVLGGWLARLGLGVEWVRVGEPLPNRSLIEVAAPGWAQAGEHMDITVTLGATGRGGDSVRVVVRQDGRALGEAALAVPAGGRTTTGRLSVRPAGPPEGAFARLEVSLEPGDALAADDRRILSVHVSAEPAGVAVVSLAPDQEPRFLLPVLARALGVPARGYLRTGAGTWVRVAEGQLAGQRVAEGDVARAVAGADLVVLQGLQEAPAQWVLQALRTAPRLLVLAGSGAASLPLPVTLGPPVAADWFVAPDLPASPVAALLAELPAEGAAPLASLRPVTAPDAWVPLRATRGRGGQGSPLLVAGEGEGRRWAVALAEGYWRWAFRGGDSRQLYDRLWSAVAGWLVRAEAGGGAGVRPAHRVVPAGERSAWVVPGARPDSLRLRLETGAGLALDTLLRATGDSVLAPVLPPGTYRYRAVAWAGSRASEGEGELVVETYTPELARPVLELADIDAARTIGAAEVRGPVRPLHTAALPYVLIVLLLAAEWILRRRWGLR